MNALICDMTCFLFRISANSMGDDGTMAKGTKYTPEFKAKAVRLLAEYRASYFVGDERDRRGGEGAGGRSGDIGALARPVGRDGRGGDEAVGRGRDGGAEEAAGRERGIASGERDFDDGVGFFAAGLDPTRR